jgi:hypothetical protein
MTVRREGTYVWVTWLARLMAGEAECGWSTWFRARHQGWAKVPTDFQLAQWIADHTRVLNELAGRREMLGETTFRESQNGFKFTSRNRVVLGGKPDLVTLGPTGEACVFDVKTGAEKASHHLQVMLYMACLPRASIPHYAGRRFSGCLVYGDGTTREIPAHAVDDGFKQNVAYFLRLLQSERAPKRVPSAQECRYCDITVADCSERVEWSADGLRELGPAYLID